MSEKQSRTVLATTEDLRQIVLSLTAGVTIGAGAATAVLLLGWAAFGLADDFKVPVLLPVLAVASAAFTLVLWASYADVSRIGRAYRTQVVDEPPS